MQIQHWKCKIGIAISLFNCKNRCLISDCMAELYGGDMLPARAACFASVINLSVALCVCGCCDWWSSRGNIRTATIFLNFVTVVRGLSKMAKPRCFFDIDIGGTSAGRVVIEVSKMAPVFGGNMADVRANLVYHVRTWCKILRIYNLVRFWKNNMYIKFYCKLYLSCMLWARFVGLRSLQNAMINFARVGFGLG